MFETFLVRLGTGLLVLGVVLAEGSLPILALIALEVVAIHRLWRWRMS